VNTTKKPAITARVAKPMRTGTEVGKSMSGSKPPVTPSAK